ncbi:hypothetical protein CERSUDRAFT_73987 [Gelatoporia subvermispora B]|uniref:Uncharacterized protein n=1 Tax=Ceriporiopsis subvermispora (strain B) TaxID=914234 RepID=M2PL18_CERS8|nr:hypothetical protein CERSUDRAFT_73987 [Gelatoporia subvermispora B]
MHADMDDALGLYTADETDNFDAASFRQEFTLDDIFIIPEDDAPAPDDSTTSTTGNRSKAMSLDFILAQDAPELAGSLIGFTPSKAEVSEATDALSYDAEPLGGQPLRPEPDSDGGAVVLGWTPPDGEPWQYVTAGDGSPSEFACKLSPGSSIQVFSVIALNARVSHITMPQAPATALCPDAAPVASTAPSNLTAPGGGNHPAYSRGSPARDNEHAHLLLPAPASYHVRDSDTKGPDAQPDPAAHAGFWTPLAPADAHQGQHQSPSNASVNTRHANSVYNASGRTQTHAGPTTKAHPPPPPRGGVCPALARSITHIRMARERAQHLERQTGRMHALPRDRVPSVMEKLPARGAVEASLGET